MGLFKSKAEKQQERTQVIGGLIEKYRGEIVSAVETYYCNSEFAMFRVYTGVDGLSAGFSGAGWGINQTDIQNRLIEETHVDSLIGILDCLEGMKSDPDSVSMGDIKKYGKKLEAVPKIYSEFKDIKAHDGFVVCDKNDIVKNNLTPEEQKEYDWLMRVDGHKAERRMEELEEKLEYDYLLFVQYPSGSEYHKDAIEMKKVPHIIIDQARKQLNTNKTMAKRKYKRFLGDL